MNMLYRQWKKELCLGGGQGVAKGRQRHIELLDYSGG